MKHLKKIILVLLCTTLFVLPFISSATCVTTQGDTTFGVDEGESLIWTTTGGAPEYSGHRFNLTIQDIYNGSHMTVDSYMINATLRYYNKTADSWLIYINNAFYVAANETQNFIDYESTVSMGGLYLIIPTPINLTMIGEYAVSTGFFVSYLVEGDKLTLEGAILGTYILTYNSDGIVTKLVAQIFGVTMVVMTLGLGGGDDIPFGFSFLIFALITIAGLVYLKKRNIK
ncbi:MAG: hypothetical protein KGD58_08120 [Candidatus Lokiarchaeota archaeon]|nr:hypothetical protein [Candidatus Lokiarchaeota archaeon]